MKINKLFSLSVFGASLLIFNPAYSKDLVFKPTEYANHHEVGCANISNETQNNPGGTWRVKPNGGCGLTSATPIYKFLTYGPYTTEVEDGSNTATFTLMAGTTGGNSLATLDVFCSTSATTLASRTIDFADFRVAYAPEDFSLNFEYTKSAQCPNLEFRVFWRGGGELQHVKTVVGRPKNQIIYPGDTPFVSYPQALGIANTAAVIKYHEVGCLAADQKSWSVLSSGRDPTSVACAATQPQFGQTQNRFMTYGPYTSALGAGVHWATFTLSRPGTFRPTGRVEVFSFKSQKILAQKQFYETDFPTLNTSYDFTIPFTYNPDVDHGLEYRVFLEKGDLSHMKTAITRKAPNDFQCTSDSSCRSAPIACVFDYPNSSALIHTVPYVARRDHNPSTPSWGPWGGEGTPKGGSCINSRPFCSASLCTANPVTPAASVVVDSNFYLDKANQSVDGSQVTYNVDANNKRSVVFNTGLNLANMRHSPYGVWAGSYELPNVDLAANSLTYFIKTKFSPTTIWEDRYKEPTTLPITAPNTVAEVVMPGALILLQPQVSNGSYFNLRIWKKPNTTEIVVTVDVCKFPGDTCNITNDTPAARIWKLNAIDLPKTIYISMRKGTISMLNQDGSTMKGVQFDGQMNFVSYTYIPEMNIPTMDAPWATMDVSILNGKPVTLEELIVSRNFIP